MADQSFCDFLTRYGQVYGPSMLYQLGTDFPAWQTQFAAAMRSLRGPLPPRCELKVTTLDTVACEGHVRHSLEIQVTSITSLPAYLLVPDDLSQNSSPSDQRRPAVIALHGHTTYGAQTIAGLDTPHVRSEPSLAYGREAVNAGYVTIIPAWWGFPGRDAHTHRLKPDNDKCNLINMAAQMYGLNVLALHLQDAQAAIDVLTQLPYVDPNKIGCIGNSYGGRVAMWLAALDSRINACVASGCTNTFRERSQRLSACAIQYFPGTLQYGDIAEIFSLIAPRPLQLMAGSADKLLNDQDNTLVHNTLLNAYQLTNADDHYEFAKHDGGHRLCMELALPFLKKHLG